MAPLNSEKHCCVFYDVGDFDGVLAFYRDILRLPVKDAWDDGHKRGAIFAVNSLVDLEIMGVGEGMTPDKPPPQHVRLKLMVTDIDAEYARLQAAGVDIIETLQDKSWGERTFGLQAPDGLLIYFYKPID